MEALGRFWGKTVLPFFLKSGTMAMLTISLFCALINKCQLTIAC